jgi:hypothetical protein
MCFLKASAKNEQEKRGKALRGISRKKSQAKT